MVEVRRRPPHVATPTTFKKHIHKLSYEPLEGCSLCTSMQKDGRNESAAKRRGMEHLRERQCECEILILWSQALSALRVLSKFEGSI